MTYLIKHGDTVYSPKHNWLKGKCIGVCVNLSGEQLFVIETEDIELRYIMGTRTTFTVVKPVEKAWMEETIEIKHMEGRSVVSRLRQI